MSGFAMACETFKILFYHISLYSLPIYSVRVNVAWIADMCCLSTYYYTSLTRDVFSKSYYDVPTVNALLTLI